MTDRPHADDAFFAALPAMTRFIEAADPSRYLDVPSDWHVVVTDVRGSTKAIEGGRYKDVNMLGAASVAAAVNASEVDLPYVFGGDGVTLLVPAAQKARVAGALRGLADRAGALFGLELRVGAVPVETLRADGRRVRLGKYQLAPDVGLAMLWGDGFGEAEARVKGAATEAQYAVTEPATEPNLEGLECRWRPVPSRNGRIVSLIAMALTPDPSAQAATYQGLLSWLERLGEEGGLSPVSFDRIALARSRSAMEPETRLRTASSGGLRHLLFGLKGVVRDSFGALIMKLGIPLLGLPDYQRSIPARSDFRKFDGVLRMVIDLSEPEYEALRAHLEAERAAGRLAFGTHSSTHALMTCLMKDLRTQHVHFIDGSNGGYALAARELKAQLKASAKAAVAGDR